MPRLPGLYAPCGVVRGLTELLTVLDTGELNGFAVLVTVFTTGDAKGLIVGPVAGLMAELTVSNKPGLKAGEFEGEFPELVGL